MHRYVSKTITITFYRKPGSIIKLLSLGGPSQNIHWLRRFRRIKATSVPLESVHTTNHCFLPSAMKMRTSVQQCIAKTEALWFGMCPLFIEPLLVSAHYHPANCFTSLQPFTTGSFFHPLWPLKDLVVCSCGHFLLLVPLIVLFFPEPPFLLRDEVELLLEFLSALAVSGKQSYGSVWMLSSQSAMYFSFFP